MNNQITEDLSLYDDALEVIKSVKYLNLATVTNDGKPWNTAVYCAFNEELNFFWLSWKENQHSINIEENASVFATIYDSSVPEGTGFGVYLQGTAHKIENVSQIVQALSCVYTRSKKKVKAAKLFLTSYPRRAYVFVPKRVWVNGDGLIKKQFVDVRHELDLTILKQKLSQ